MNIKSSTLTVGDIEALVLRKPIKNMHVAVMPPNGKVRVSVPLSTKDDVVHALVATRLSWIKKQRQKFKEQVRQTRREYISGESHYLWGEKYRLEVIYDGKLSRVEMKGKKIVLFVHPGSSRAKREQVMLKWYREELRNAAGALVQEWQEKMGVNLKEWRIKNMKTKWGTCNEKARRIWLNLKLAKKPENCLIFIIVHEMTHLLERHHNDRFKSHMDKFLPKWRHYKDELNRSALSWEEWGY